MSEAPPAEVWFNQTNIGTVSKATLGRLLRDKMGRLQVFTKIFIENAIGLFVRRLNVILPF